MTDATPPPLRLGVLGCGRVFERFHLPAIDRVPAVMLAAACDTDPHRLQWAARRSSRPAVFDSPTRLLKGADLEALLVLTPPPHHAVATVRALEAGLHVLVEKPMAINPQEGHRMIDAAQQSRRRLQIGFNRRFRGAYRQVHELLSGADRPEVRFARFELSFPISTWKSRSDFLGDDRMGGGVLDDVLSHQVDLLCWLFGAPYEVRAQALDSRRLEADLRFDGLTIRCHSAHGPYAERLELGLSDGRVLEASGSGLRMSTGRSPSWGRRRAIVLDRLALMRDRIRGRPNATLASFEHQLRDFERAARGGQPDGAGGEDGLLAVEIVQACRASAGQSGNWRALAPSARPVGSVLARRAGSKA